MIDRFTEKKKKEKDPDTVFSFTLELHIMYRTSLNMWTLHTCNDSDKTSAVCVCLCVRHYVVLGSRQEILALLSPLVDVSSIDQCTPPVNVNVSNSITALASRLVWQRVKFNGQIVTISTRPCGKCRGGQSKCHLIPRRRHVWETSWEQRDICIDSVNGITWVGNTMYDTHT